jgi:hypothetical protein
VEAEGSDDMDLFVAVQKLDRDGQPLGQTFYASSKTGRSRSAGFGPATAKPIRPKHAAATVPHTFANSGWRRAKSCR